jgi:hypothetical protein
MTASRAMRVSNGPRAATGGGLRLRRRENHRRDRVTFGTPPGWSLGIEFKGEAKIVIERDGVIPS